MSNFFHITHSSDPLRAQKILLGAALISFHKVAESLVKQWVSQQ